MLRLSVFVVVIGTASRAAAGGFEIPEQGAAATGMAGARTALSDAPDTVFYNPAGLTGASGTAGTVGSSLAVIKSTAEAANSGQTPTVANSVVPIPFLFLTSKLTNDLGVGIGFFDQFGSSIRWSALNATNFPGRFVADYTNLTAFNINPEVAFGPFSGVSVGVGVDVILAAATLEQALPFGDTEGSVRLGGSTQTAGANLGLMYDAPGKIVSFGYSYRSQVNLNFTHFYAHFTAPPELSATVFDQPAATKIMLPDNMTWAVAVRPLDNLTFDLDVHYTLWSEFSTLAVTFPTSSTPGLSTPQNWTNSTSLGLGAEWLPREHLVVRLGFGYDWTPIPDDTLSPTVPGINRYVTTAGLGYTVQGFSIDLSYLAAFSGSRTSTLATFPATYTQFINLLSLGLSYRLPNWPKTQGG